MDRANEIEALDSVSWPEVVNVGRLVKNIRQMTVESVTAKSEDNAISGGKSIWTLWELNP